MFNIKALIGIIIMCIGLHSAAETAPWTEEEKLWGAIVVTALVADWGTTRDATSRWKEGYYETNPLLGRTPTRQEVDTHFILWIPIVLIVADQLPHEQRKFFLATTSIIEIYGAANNMQLGFRIRF